MSGGDVRPSAGAGLEPATQFLFPGQVCPRDRDAPDPAVLLGSTREAGMSGGASPSLEFSDLSPSPLGEIGRETLVHLC